MAEVIGQVHVGHAAPADLAHDAVPGSEGRSQSLYVVRLVVHPAVLPAIGVR
jgi:hypothetical protein